MTRQADFRAALLDAGRPVPDGLIGPMGTPATARYAVYRNNVTQSLIEALTTAFPLVRKLIGDQNFANLAPLYVRDHPPKSPMMMHYGVEFPAFLAGFTPLSHIGYLADAARLDLAMRAAYHAADAPPLDLSQLQSLPHAKLLASRVILAPSVRTIRSNWPLYDIWRFNHQPDAPKPLAVAQDVLITRPEFDPQPHPLPPGAADWLDHLAAGHSIDTAHDATLAKMPDFDLGTCLTLALTTHAIVAVTDKELK
tara:strand:- start:151938 stop:152696 length:759 start_codon:yes stop_codon:yes gene_type:complete